MLILLVVLAFLVFGAAVVVMLDRMGLLGPGRAVAGSGDGSLLERVPKSSLAVAMALMAAWILAWLLVLVIGLGVLAA